jgi:methylated-DNA-protein-cysteine methyltransferase related protein
MRQRILTAIRKIPRGKVSTYGAVACAAGFPGAARQVVAALRQSVGLPWHRVLGAGGQIKLQGESAFEQRFRLQAEGVTFRGKRADMAKHEFKFRHKSQRPKAQRPKAKN